MKWEKIEKRLGKAVKSKSVCYIELAYEKEGFKMLPLTFGKKLVVGIRDNDISANGYSIIDVDDIEKIKIKDAVHADDDTDETTVNISVNGDSWEQTFSLLKESGQIVIVECSLLQKKEDRYVIGQIEEVGAKNVSISYCGPDKIWSGKKWTVLYSNITQATTGSKYTEFLRTYMKTEDNQE